jgi:hypothetical protein
MRCDIDWKVNLDPHRAFISFLKRAQLTIQFHNRTGSFEGISEGKMRYGN